MPAGDPAALIVSDIHISKAPSSRKDDWRTSTIASLREVQDWANELAIPIICCGDVFDKWNSPAELINFAFDHLPEMHAIPGQHDLPNHSIEEIQRSAFWTLVQAGKIRRLFQVEIRKVCFYGIPWGQAIPEPADKERLNVAIIHAYVWKREHSHPQASDATHYKKWSKVLADKGYDLAFFGDNHSAFDVRAEIPIINCGSLMRRRIDQIDYQPVAYLLYDSGYYRAIDLEAEEEQAIFSDAQVLDDLWDDLSERSKDFVQQLKSLSQSSTNFVSALTQAVDQGEIKEAVRRIVMEAIDEA